VYFWEIKQNDQQLKSLCAVFSAFNLDGKDRIDGATSDQNLAEKVASLGKDTIRSLRLDNSIWMDGMHNVSDRSIELLISLPHLEDVSLFQSHVTEQGIIELLRTSRSIKRIGAPIILTADVAKAVVANGHIEQLTVYSATDEGLEIVTQHQQLIELSLGEFSEKQIEILRKSPSITSVMSNGKTIGGLFQHCERNKNQARQWGRVAFNMTYIRATKNPYQPGKVNPYKPYAYSGLSLVEVVMQYVQGTSRRR